VIGRGVRQSEKTLRKQMIQYQTGSIEVGGGGAKEPSAGEIKDEKRPGAHVKPVENGEGD